MKKHFIYPIFLLVFVFIIAGCSDSNDPNQGTPSFNKVDDLVEWCGKPSDPATYKNETNKKTVSGTSAAGVKKTGTATTYSRADVFERYVNFGDKPSNTLFPGNIVEGADLPIGQLTSLGEGWNRKPITLTLTGGESEVVENPTYSNVNTAIKKLVSNYTTTAADMQYKLEMMHSREQSLMDVGISANWSFFKGAGASVNYEQGSSIDKTSMLLYFRQVYYTISIGPKSSASGYFAENNDLNKLAKRTNKNNPLCVVTEVDYGRIVIVKITSTKSIDSMKSDISAGLNIGSLGVGGTYKPSSSKFDASYSFEAQIYGGNNEKAVIAVSSRNINDIIDYIQSGATYSANNAGQPISYKVNYLYGNSLAKVGCATEYTETNWKEASNKVKLHIDGFTLLAGASSMNLEAYWDIWVNGSQTSTTALSGTSHIQTYESSKLKMMDGQYATIDKDIGTIDLSITPTLYLHTDIKDDDAIGYTQMITGTSGNGTKTWSANEIKNMTFGTPITYELSQGKYKIRMKVTFYEN
ncbi:MAG: thiol-activated cytolysin family protein [Bacteroidales bacterium]|jgi:hypothetical protein|nr:thiol-activated cytolysin family protein [Bacteroidales bacterium]